MWCIHPSASGPAAPALSEKSPSLQRDPVSQQAAWHTGTSPAVLTSLAVACGRGRFYQAAGKHLGLQGKR